MQLISPLQFGFRKKHSTGHALVSISERIKRVVDAGNFACGIFLDFQKAFDTVNINILVDKMYNYGILNHTLMDAASLSALTTSAKINFL